MLRNFSSRLLSHPRSTLALALSTRSYHHNHRPSNISLVPASRFHRSVAPSLSSVPSRNTPLNLPSSSPVAFFSQSSPNLSSNDDKNKNSVIFPSRNNEYQYFAVHHAQRSWSQRIQDPKFVLAIFLLLLLLGYILYHIERAPVTDRRQLLLLSRAREMKIGDRAFQQVLSSSTLLPDTHHAVELVKRVGRRIAQSANQREYSWEFVVVKDDSVNAFCLPGGKVVVHTGLLENLENEDQLAAVLSHEIAHAVARHGGEKISISGVGGAILIAASLPVFLHRLVVLMLNLPYSRRMEVEADHIGLMLMAKACYDPEAAPSVFERLEELSSTNDGLEYLSTHPSNKNRIQNLQTLMPQAMDEVHKHCKLKHL